VLTVFDDGKTDGELIRIRDHRFFIGRAEGDLCIPLDGRISARHVEITHQMVGGLHRWVITDLQSTHGMYVRVSRTALADKAEFLVGNGRYRFDSPQSEVGPTVDHVPNGGGFSETHGWNEGASTFRPPAVTELIGSEIGNRMLLIKNEYWCGSTAAARAAAGTPNTPRPRTGSGYVWPRSQSSRRPSFKLASSGSSSG
jgi:hypothetical protein